MKNVEKREVFTWDKQIHEMSEDELRAGLREMAEENQVVFAPMPWQKFWDKFRALFRCQQCGACCTHEMSQQERGIGLLEDELVRLVTLKDMKSQEFRAKYCRQSSASMDYPCPFYKPGGCSIYEQRPIVCRFFPLDGMEVDGEKVLGVQVVCPGGLKAMTQLMIEHRRSLLDDALKQKGEI